MFFSGTSQVEVSDDEPNGINFIMEAPQRHDKRVIVHLVSQTGDLIADNYWSVAHPCDRTMVCMKNKVPLLPCWLLRLDCFYAAVFEKENPSWKFLPLAVQQKQIIVTCNYEARRRGIYKLQLVHEAKKLCPDVILVLGEDLTRFRNASKNNFNFLRGFSWSNKVERLGFDEVSL